MATVTGTNLLDSVLASTGATMSDAAKLVTAARLQAMIDAGFDTGINIALVLSAASSDVKEKVPVLGDLATTVDTAKTDIEGGGTVGETFTLTTGVDAGADFTGTDNNDTYNASVLTANDGDTLDGGDGDDVLNLETASNITDKFVTTGIETVNVNALGNLTVDVKNMGGITTLNSNDAAGNVTINNISSATTAFGVKGSTTNNLDLNYAANVLSGTSDTLSVTLGGATNATVTADSGFETVSLANTAKSNLTSLTATNAKSLIINSTSELEVESGSINAFETYTISGAGQFKYDGADITSVKTFNASGNEGGVVSADLQNTVALDNGTASNAIVLSSGGSLIQTGSGADNIAVNSQALLSTSSAIVKLGDGNDTLALTAGNSGDYVYGEGGNDTFYLANSTQSTDLIDGGAGSDTLNLAGNKTFAMIGKSIENIATEGATGQSSTVVFTSIDSATAITDNSVGAVTFTNILKDSTFQSTKVKDALTTLNFKSGEAATINADFTKGTTGGLTTTNAANVTVTLGATSALGTNDITLDSAGTALSVNATGAFSMDDILHTGSEKLSTVAVTGDKAVTVDDITNAGSLTSVSVSSTGGDVSVGDIASATATGGSKAYDISKIEVKSDKGGATFGDTNATDLTGLANQLDSNVTAITATATGVTATDHAAIGNIAADKVGTVTATASTANATIGNLEVGKDTSGTTVDGTVTSVTASGFLAASVGNIAADSVGTITVTSSDTTTGGDVSLGVVTDAQGTVSNPATPVYSIAEIGNVTVTTNKGAAEISDGTFGADDPTIDVAKLGNVTLTGTTTATAEAIYVRNADGDATMGNVTITAGSGAATAGNIVADVAGDISVKSSAAGVVANSMVFGDSSGVAVTLDAKTSIASTTNADYNITNSKGDLNVTAKAGTTLAAAEVFTVDAGTAGATTDIDVLANFSGVTGNAGKDTTDYIVVSNQATDSSSSVTVYGGKAANFITIDADGGEATYYGQTGADTITLKDGATYSKSVIKAETGADNIYIASGQDNVNLGTDTDADVLFVQDIATDSLATNKDIIENFIIANDKINMAATVNGTTASGAITFDVATDVATGASAAGNKIDTGMYTFDGGAATSLDDAISKVGADVKTAGNAVIFEYNNNTYFFVDVDSAATTAADMVIELSGVDSASMTAASEVFTIA